MSVAKLLGEEARLLFLCCRAIIRLLDTREKDKAEAALLEEMNKLQLGIDALVDMQSDADDQNMVCVLCVVCIYAFVCEVCVCVFVCGCVY